MLDVVSRTARNIKRIRKDKKIRQIDMERLSGVAYRHYQAIESGRVNLSLETLDRIAKALESTPAILVGPEAI